MNWIRICLIYLESMKRAMVEFEIDLTKMPLGKLSKAHVQKERVTFIIHLLTFFYLKVTIFSNLLCLLILKLYLYISEWWALGQNLFLEPWRFFTLKGTKRIIWTSLLKFVKPIESKCLEETTFKVCQTYWKQIFRGNIFKVCQTYWKQMLRGNNFQSFWNLLKGDFFKILFCLILSSGQN